MYQITATATDPIEERAQLQEWMDFQADDPFSRMTGEDVDQYFEDTHEERTGVFD